MSAVYTRLVREFNRKPSQVSRRKRFTLAEMKVLDRDGYKCHYCGETECLTIDHVVPRSKGGTNEQSNLLTACHGCNASKGAKSYSEYMEWRAVELATYVAMQTMVDCL